MLLGYKNAHLQSDGLHENKNTDSAQPRNAQMSPDPSPCERVWSEDKNSAADKILGSKKATHFDCVNNYYNQPHNYSW